MAHAALSEKSPEAFRTISEVAEMLDVPQHVLRFWETRFSHIKPIKRAGGRRFYRPEDVALLRGIRLLLYYDGYTIRGAQKVLREKGARFVVQLGRDELRTNGAEIEPEEFEPVAEIATFEDVEPEKDEREFVAPVVRVNGTAGSLDANRRHLESLLDELLALKSRLADARDRTSG